MFPGIDTCTNYGDWADWRIGRTFSGVFCCCPTSPRLRLPLLSNFCKFLQFARWLNSFTHPSFVTPSLFGNPALPVFQNLSPHHPSSLKIGFSKSFGSSPWLASGLVFATNVVTLHSFQLNRFPTTQRGRDNRCFSTFSWLAVVGKRATNLFLNCKSVFLAPGSDLWVGWCGQQI